MKNLLKSLLLCFCLAAPNAWAKPAVVLELTDAQFSRLVREATECQTDASQVKRADAAWLEKYSKRVKSVSDDLAKGSETEERLAETYRAELAHMNHESPLVPVAQAIQKKHAIRAKALEDRRVRLSNIQFQIEDRIESLADDSAGESRREKRDREKDLRQATRVSDQLDRISAGMFN